MKKKTYQGLYIIAGILCTCFVVTMIVEIMNYNANVTSFPLYAIFLLRMYQYILPALFVFLLGYIIKKVIIRK